MNPRLTFPLHFLLTFTLFVFIIPSPSPTPVTKSSPLHLCKLASVSFLPPSACPRPPSHQCRWQLKAIPIPKPCMIKPSTLLKLSLPETYPYYTSHQLRILSQLDGCNSTLSCTHPPIHCAPSIEDPSDALWLRHYNTGSKFLVILRVAFLSLIFYIAAIICDASLFRPHRPGSFAASSAAALAIIACAALLYILVVPREWQLSLWGAGWWQTLCYVSLILAIAAALPGVTVVWVNFCLLVIYFLAFVVEQMFCVLAGVLHYFGALTLYQLEYTLFHLRLIYYRHVEEDVELDQRLLDMSDRFLRRVRGNTFLYRIPNALEQDGLQVVEGVLPEQLYDELDAHVMPNVVDFETIASNSEEGGAERRDDSVPHAGTPLLQRDSPT